MDHFETPCIRPPQPVRWVVPPSQRDRPINTFRGSGVATPAATAALLSVSRGVFVYPPNFDHHRVVRLLVPIDTRIKIVGLSLALLVRHSVCALFVRGSSQQSLIARSRSRVRWTRWTTQEVYSGTGRTPIM